MLKKSIIISVLGIALFFQACHKKDNDNAMVATSKFELNDMNKASHTVDRAGNNFNLDDSKGKIILFDIFATWCPPCRAEASHLASLQTKYKNDLIVAGVSIQKDITKEELVSFQKEYGANYMMLFGGENQKVAQAIASTLQGVEADFPIPLMAMYKDGVLINFYVGATPEEIIESDIKKALGK